MTTRELIAHLSNQRLTEQQQKALAQLAARVNQHRKQKANRTTTIHPDAAAYMDAHNIPLPKE